MLVHFLVSMFKGDSKLIIGTKMHIIRGVILKTMGGGNYKASSLHLPIIDPFDCQICARHSTLLMTAQCSVDSARVIQLLDAWHFALYM